MKNAKLKPPWCENCKHFSMINMTDTSSYGQQHNVETPHCVKSEGKFISYTRLSYVWLDLYQQWYLQPLKKCEKYKNFMSVIKLTQKLEEL